MRRIIAVLLLALLSWRAPAVVAVSANAQDKAASSCSGANCQQGGCPKNPRENARAGRPPPPSSADDRVDGDIG